MNDFSATQTAGVAQMAEHNLSVTTSKIKGDWLMNLMATLVAEQSFSVEGRAESASKLVAQTRRFSMIVDEPPALGGKDEGPNPVEYLLTGLIGCLNVMFHLIAKEQGIKIEQLEFSTTGLLDLRTLFGKAGAERAGFQSIVVDVKLTAKATEEQKQRLLSAVESRCPISDNIRQITPLEVRLL
jgi:uncharacterized OsmC-like protein